MIKNRVHTTLAGHRIEFVEPDAKVDKFLWRVQTLLNDPKATENDMIALMYGRENPILEHSDSFPERGMVTKAVLEHPVYQVLTDLLARKSLAARDLDPARLAKAYTLSVAQAAEKMGISEDGVRRAIHARRLPSWVKEGQYFLDPATLTPASAGQRGPLGAKAQPLEVKGGVDSHVQLMVRHAGGEVPKERRPVAEATIPRWKRVAVLMGGNGKLRLFVLEPSAEEKEIKWHRYHVRGKFQIVERFNGSKAAREAWEKFDAA